MSKPKVYPEASPAESRADMLFKYTHDQATAIHNALNEAGLQRDVNWPECFDYVTSEARTAIARKTDQLYHPRPNRTEAIEQLRALRLALQRLSNHVEAEIKATLANMSDGRRRFAPQYIIEAIDLLLARWEADGMTFDLAGGIRILKQISPKVAAIVERVHTKRPYKPRRAFPKGPKQDEATRRFLHSLCSIYHNVTGSLPPSVGYNGKTGCATGRFYTFAKAALLPIPLVEKYDVDHAIRLAVTYYRSALVLPKS